MSNNYELLLQENNELKEKISKIELELQQTKEHLKQYTAPIRNKIYYKENKEQHKQRVKEYKKKSNYNETLSKEKKKEYARTAYLNKKAKISNIIENQNI
jgi:hypothetical protein